jgi:ATP-dependent Clp protease adaptor protein ClpS
MEVLKHHLHQAEQCAMIIHTKGKCSVKEGGHDGLKPFRDALTERGLKAVIE